MLPVANRAGNIARISPPYVTEHKVRPAQSYERIVAGQPVPREVQLEAVPADWVLRSPGTVTVTRADGDAGRSVDARGRPRDRLNLPRRVA